MANNAKKAADNTVQEIDETISKSEQFVEKNRNIISYILIAIIVLVAGVYGWNTYNKAQNAKAQNAIWQSQFLFESGDYEQAFEGFDAVVNQYGSTQTGNLARGYAGLCKKELGQYDEAISYLKQYKGDDAVIAPALLSALGDCYVSVENPDYGLAARTFEEAASKADNAQYTPLFLKKAGLAYEAAGKKDDAQRVYRQIKEKWLETRIGQSIDKYIYRVQ